MGFDAEEIFEEFAEAQGYGEAARAELWRDGWRFITRKGRAKRTADQVREYLRAWKAAHPERLREYARARLLREPKTVRRQARERQRRYRERNRERLRAVDREAKRRMYHERKADPAWMSRRRAYQMARYYAKAEGRP